MTSGRATNHGLDLCADMRTVLRSIGIEVTATGMAQARRRRLEAAARHTPERRAAWSEAAFPLSDSSAEGAVPRSPGGRGPIRIILDTSAILAFTRGSAAVGDAAAEVADGGGLIGLPIPCLVEARWRLGDLERLSLLVHHRATELITAPDDWSALAAAVTVAGRQDAAAALLAAVQSGCDVLTANPRLYAGLAGSPVLPIPR